MKPANTTLKWALTLFGLIGGTVGMILHVRMTDFPIDMVIYREGVKAYLEGRSMYSEPMMVKRHCATLHLPAIRRARDGATHGA